MRTWFGAHMAGLTKTYQVAANICIFCGGELAEQVGGGYVQSFS